MEPFLSSALVGILGAVSGAAAGFWLKSPKPSIQILDVLVDPMHSNDQRGMEREIFREGASNFFVAPSDIRLQSIRVPYVSIADRYYQHPQLYCFWLYTVARDTAKIRIIHKEMPKIVKELRLSLNGGLLDDYYSTWSDYSQILREHVIKGKIDGSFFLNTKTIEELTSEGSNKKHPVSIDNDGDYIVHSGSKHIMLAWTPHKSLKDQTQSLMSQVAAAFAFEDISTIDLIQKHIETVKWDDPDLDKIEKLARNELRRMSRIAVRGVISNSGHSPVSISGSGQIYIDCRGFSYRSEDTSRVQKVENDLVFPIQFVDDDYIQTLPSLEVQPGSVRSFTAVTPFYLYEIDESTRNHILNIYGSDKKFHVKFKRLDTECFIQSHRAHFRQEETKHSIQKMETGILMPSPSDLSTV